MQRQVAQVPAAHIHIAGLGSGPIKKSKKNKEASSNDNSDSSSFNKRAINEWLAADFIAKVPSQLVTSKTFEDCVSTNAGKEVSIIRALYTAGWHLQGFWQT